MVYFKRVGDGFEMFKVYVAVEYVMRDSTHCFKVR